MIYFLIAKSQSIKSILIYRGSEIRFAVHNFYVELLLFLKIKLFRFSEYENNGMLLILFFGKVD